MNEPILSTEQQLQALVGLPESLRLEFKRSAPLAEPKEREKYFAVLSREISALANTEGGQIVIGMDEERAGKTRVASGLDEGIALAEFSIESFQQAIQSSVSPYLPSLRILPVRLSGNKAGQAAIVIVVPQGTTAYQAKDQKYYGRSEFAVEALRDHEIRLRMMRPRVALGRIAVRPLERVDFGDISHYKFVTQMYNVGEITIHNYVIVLAFGCNAAGLGEHTSAAVRNGKDYRITGNFGGDHENLLHPGDSVDIPRESWLVVLPTQTQFAKIELQCTWKLMLEDAPASTGILDVSSLEFPVYVPPLPPLKRPAN
jgi:hypothetical protein